MVNEDRSEAADDSLLRFSNTKNCLLQIGMGHFSPVIHDAS